MADFKFQPKQVVGLKAFPNYNSQCLIAFVESQASPGPRSSVCTLCPSRAEPQRQKLNWKSINHKIRSQAYKARDVARRENDLEAPPIALSFLQLQPPEMWCDVVLYCFKAINLQWKAFNLFGFNLNFGATIYRPNFDVATRLGPMQLLCCCCNSYCWLITMWNTQRSVEDTHWLKINY